MLLRLLKLTRLFELIQVIKCHSNLNSSVGTIIQLFCTFMVAAHIMSCGYIFIGQREFE